MGGYRLGWGWAGVGRDGDGPVWTGLPGWRLAGMDKIAIMTMSEDRSEWEWAGMGMDRIASMRMGQDGQDCRDGEGTGIGWSGKGRDGDGRA